MEAAISNQVRDYWPISPKTAQPPAAIGTQEIIGFDLARSTLAEISYWIAERAQSYTHTRIAFLNAHCANIARKDWRYRSALKSSDALLPDGSGIALAAKLDGIAASENLNGTDLFDPLCRCLALRRLPVFFLGGQEGVAQAAAEKTKERIPGFRVAGHRNGYFSPEDEDAVIREINRSGARVVLVAFGVPDQDIWIARVQNRIHAPVILGVGGLLDFVSGRIPRAPLWMRKLGIEWVYRLRCEPKRMWKRYLIGNVTFAANAAIHTLRRRLPKAVSRCDLLMKRLIDVCGAGLGLIALAPLLLTVALLVRVESKGPAIFRQIRVGENGKPFELWKFRSMRMDAPDSSALKSTGNDRDDGITFKLKRDPRVTRIGAFIRKYSIDELPQLWNVLKGEMSLVGPRPALPKEVGKYSPEARQRLNGKPGLTCTWQISGRADLPFDQQVFLDVSYLRERTIWTDLLILLKTPIAVITARGAY